MVSHRSRILFGLFLAFLIAGSVQPASALQQADTAVEQAASSKTPVDVNWLADTLRQQGHVVVERGLIRQTVFASRSRRLSVDGDVVDVFAFTSEATAQHRAHEFALRYPLSDVYLKDDLVVVHRSRRSPGLSSTLYEVLGRLV